MTTWDPAGIWPPSMDVPRTLRPGDGPYPGLLAQIPDRPPALRVRGELRPDARRAAVVGSRDMDGYGEELTRSIAAGLGLWLVLRILWRGFREEQRLDRSQNPWK